MKVNKIIIFLFLLFLGAKSQDADSTVNYEIITLNGYNNECVIFPVSFIPGSGFSRIWVKGRFTPSIDEIIKAEKTLRDISHMIMGHCSGCIEEVDEKLMNFNRQYLGFITPKGEKVISIVLFYYKHEYFEPYFKNWKKEFYNQIATGNLRTYLYNFDINLRTAKLNISSKPLVDFHMPMR